MIQYSAMYINYIQFYSTLKSWFRS